MRQFISKLRKKEGKGKKPQPETDAATAHEEPIAARIAIQNGSDALNNSVSVIQPSSSDLNISEQLWSEAYAILRERDKNLVQEYEAVFSGAANGEANSLSSPETVKELVQRLRAERDGKQAKFSFRAEEHRYRDQFKKIVKLAVFADSLVKQALAAQPYAALAWTGVSLLLPLLSSALTKEEDLTKGFVAVAHVQLYWKSCEDAYLKPSAIKDYGKIARQLPTVYSHILEYQFNAICYLAKDKKHRMWQVTTGWTSWSNKANDIEKESEFCKSLLEPAHQSALEVMNASKLQKMDSLYEATLDIAKVMIKNRAEDMEMEICKNLKRVAGNYESDKNNNPVHVKGTCEWFFHDDDFCNWRDSTDGGLYWVSADPGCGKSVLARSLIDDGHLKSTVATFNITSSVATVRERSTIVCYFFFKEGASRRTNLSNAFSAILHKLFAEDETNQLIQHAVAQHKLNNEFLTEDFEPLWEILVACASSDSGGDVICVLDALDECERQDRTRLMDKLQSYYSEVKGRQKLKFFITSRPYKTVTRMFDSFSRHAKLIHLDGDDKHDELSRDMDLVIDARLHEITEFFSKKDRERVRERLRSQESKTYLWLHLTFGILKESPSKYSRSWDVEALLSTIPPQVSQAYEEILDRTEDEEMTVVLLHIILAARAPLTLAEANYALTLAGTHTSFQRHDDLVERCYGLDFRSTVKDLCGLIITIHDGCLHFIHLTARQFLLSDKPDRASKWKGRFALGPGLHQTLSYCCTSYLTLNSWTGIASGKSVSQKSDQERDFPFLKYASLNWSYHFGQLDKVLRTATKQDARRLVGASGPYIKVWATIFLSSEDIQVSLALDDFDGWTDLAIASLLGLHGIVEEMLVDEKISPNTPSDCFMGSALNAAVSGRNEATAALLLSHGADVHGEGTEIGPPLDIAINFKHLGLVRLLLSHGADPWAKTPRAFRNDDSVELAAERGTPEIFRAVAGCSINWETAEGIEKAITDMAKESHIHLTMLVRAMDPSFPLTQRIVDTLLEYSEVGYSVLDMIINYNQGKIVIGPHLLQCVLRAYQLHCKRTACNDLTLFTRLLQNKEAFGVSITRKILCDTAGIQSKEFLALLLDHYTGPNITAELLIRALRDNQQSGKIELLLQHGNGTVDIGERLLWAAACTQGSDSFAKLLDYKGDKPLVTPRVMRAAVRSLGSDAFDKLELIIKHTGQLYAEDQALFASVALYGNSTMMKLLLERAGPAFIPSEIVLCSAASNDSAVLKFLLERFSGKISITPAVTMAAARGSKWYQNTLSWLLRDRPDEIIFTPELLQTETYLDPTHLLRILKGWKDEELRQHVVLALVLCLERNSTAGLTLLVEDGYITPGMMTEEVLSAMAKNRMLSLHMIRYLMRTHERYITITTGILEQLVGNSLDDVVEVLDLIRLHRSEDFRITRDVMEAAAKNGKERVLQYLSIVSEESIESEWTTAAQLRSAARHGDKQGVLAALERAADPNSRSLNGQTALHEAAALGHAEVVRLLATRPEVDVNAADSHGKRPLHDCKKDKDARLLLCEAGADANVADKDDNTPLHTAIRYRRYDQVRLLVEAGADVDSADRRGMTPRMLADDLAEEGDWTCLTLIERW